MREMVTKDGHFDNHSLAGRYVSPGYTLECMWFAYDECRLHGYQGYSEQCAKVIDNAFELGWDDEYGGLLLFVDFKGGMPQGIVSGIDDEVMLKKVQNDWSDKLWWVHSEGLYSLLRAYIETKNASFFEMFKKLHEYTFRIFPNTDKSTGEWIQIRDRKGIPAQKLVALPVKDPFHVIRDLAALISLLSSCEDQHISGAERL